MEELTEIEQLLYHGDNDPTATAITLNWMVHGWSSPFDSPPILLAIADPPHFEVKVKTHGEIVCLIHMYYKNYQILL